MSKILDLALQAGLRKEHGSDREYIGDFDWRLFAKLVSANTCKRCGVVHDDDPVDAEKIVNDAAAALAREIDMEALKAMGAWIDDDKDYQIGTQDKYEEFVKRRNYRITNEKPSH